jgi:hypothetical protein
VNLTAQNSEVKGISTRYNDDHVVGQYGSVQKLKHSVLGSLSRRDETRQTNESFPYFGTLPAKSPPKLFDGLSAVHDALRFYVREHSLKCMRIGATRLHLSHEGKVDEVAFTRYMKQVASAEVWLDDFGSVFADALRIFGFKDKSRSMKCYPEATHTIAGSKCLHAFEFSPDGNPRSNAATKVV